jgi:geranylgeranyl pyrophosphate synthase
MNQSRSSRLLDLLEDHFSLDGLERALGTSLDEVPPELWEAALLGPLRDLLARPGKSVRAALVEAAWRMSGAPGAPPDLLPLVIEVLHAGSLVIDDIEDDAVERRGGPALHRLYGVPRALNAGNWLYFWSELLLERLALGPARELEARRLLTSTFLRCHHGQALDLTARVTELEKAEIPGVVSAVTSLKTGSLIALAMRLGALVGEATPACAQALGSFGSGLGMGLQMLDDLGGITSQQRWHKGQEDLASARLTWPWAWLAAELDTASFARLRDQARAVAESQSPARELAATMRNYLAERGQDRIGAHLASILATLRESVPDASLCTLVEQTVERLRGSYG